MNIARTSLLYCLMTIGVTCSSSPPSPPVEELLASRPATAPATQPTTPTEVFRTLLIAMTNGDQTGVEAVIVPHPDSAILWGGAPLAPERREEANNLVRSGLTMYEVKAGTLVQLPGNLELYVTEEMIDQNRKLYWPMLGFEKMPTPFWFQRAPGGPWKVDAGPLIAARLKAKEVLATRPHLGGSTRPASK